MSQQPQRYDIEGNETMQTPAPPSITPVASEQPVLAADAGEIRPDHATEDALAGTVEGFRLALAQ